MSVTEPSPAATPATAAGKVSVRVERKVPIADGVVEVDLVDLQGGILPAWAPGAHIGLVLAPNLVRQYSLCGEVSDRRRYRIAVLREAQSRGGSAFIHDRLAETDVIPISEPRNNFELVESDKYLFVAGGIGVTPFLAMIEEAERRGAAWRLAYGGRATSSMAYLDRLRSIYPDQVTEYPFDQVGHIPLANVLAKAEPGTELYCCGPQPLLDAITEGCASRSLDRLHIERFSREALDDADTEFEVVLNATGRTITVPVGKSLLEVIEEAGVPIDSSCRDGSCSSCEVAVLEGTPDHRDVCLSEEERAACDSMMVCVSRSRGPRLVIDL